MTAPPVIRNYSTAAKYTGLLDLFFMQPFEPASPNLPSRSAFHCLIETTDKEGTKSQAEGLAKALRRQLKPLNEAFLIGTPASKAPRYVVNKSFGESSKLQGWFFYITLLAPADLVHLSDTEIFAVMENNSHQVPEEVADE